MSEETRPIVEGRPDLEDHDFGKTLLKKFPPYVYSLLGGMLVHRIARVEAQWYEPIEGSRLRRRDRPRLTFIAACGAMFYEGRDRLAFGPRRNRFRAQTCSIPKPEAVLCGRCKGEGPIFGKGSTVDKDDARRRIGCVLGG